jgi:hypothetical protein
MVHPKAKILLAACVPLIVIWYAWRGTRLLWFSGMRFGSR